MWFFACIVKHGEPSWVMTQMAIYFDFHIGKFYHREWCQVPSIQFMMPNFPNCYGPQKIHPPWWLKLSGEAYDIADLFVSLIVTMALPLEKSLDLYLLTMLSSSLRHLFQLFMVGYMNLSWYTKNIKRICKLYDN